MNNNINDVTLQFFSNIEIEDLQDLIQQRIITLEHNIAEQRPNQTDPRFYESYVTSLSDELGRLKEHDRRLEEALK